MAHPDSAAPAGDDVASELHPTKNSTSSEGHDLMVADVLRPSGLNFLIVGAMIFIWNFIFRWLAAYTSDGPTGGALAWVC